MQGGLRCESRTVYLFVFLVLFSCILGMLSTKRAYSVDRELKFRILSMKSGVFMDRTYKTGLLSMETGDFVDGPLFFCSIRSLFRLAEIFCLRSVSISADSRSDDFHRHSQSGNHPIENSNTGYYHSVFDTRYI